MPLPALSSVPKSLYVQAGSFIYKFKIRRGSSYSEEEVIGGDYFDQELEEIVRTILGNLDNLQPFSSSHFNVFPYKKLREGVPQVICNPCGNNLRAYPYVIVLYLEKNVERGRPTEEKLSSETETVSEPQAKRCRTDAPRERGTLKDLVSEFEDESETSETDRQHVDDFCLRGEAIKDPGQVDKKGARGFVEPQQKPDVSTTGGNETPGELDSRSIQDMAQEEEEEASVLGPAAKPGILTRLASRVFPFSLLFKDP